MTTGMSVSNTDTATFALFPDPSYSSDLSGTLGSYGEDWCGYHSIGTFRSQKKQFNAPYFVVGQGPGKGSKCYWDVTPYLPPNGKWEDFSLRTTAAQLIGMVSNPESDAWYDDYKLESGEKCNSNPGAANLISPNDASDKRIYNAIIGKKYYLLQSNYDLQSNSCPQVIY